MKKRRIVNSGLFFGLQGPTDNLDGYSEDAIALAQRAGAIIEWYEVDTLSNKPKVEVKKADEGFTKVETQETKDEFKEEKVADESLTIDVVDQMPLNEPVIELNFEKPEADDLDKQIEEKVESLELEELFGDDKAMILTDEGSVEVVEKNYDLEDVKDVYYTDEMLANMTRQEMLDVLKGRGFTKHYDPFRGKTTDDKNALAKKIKDSQSENSKYEADDTTVEVTYIMDEEDSEIQLTETEKKISAIADKIQLPNHVEDDVEDDGFDYESIKDYDNNKDKHKGVL